MAGFYQGMNAVNNEWQYIELMYSNLQNFSTPGYKAADFSFQEELNDGQSSGAFEQRGSMTFTQGKVHKTGNALDLAINEGESGSPCSTLFVLSDGERMRYTRAGHFAWKEGKLIDPLSNLHVQGYALNAKGNQRSKKLQDISLELDPKTGLYGGMYTGYHFGENGKLYGEVRISDPLTKQSVTKTVPIYQVALASFPDPGGLARFGNTTTYEAAESATKPIYGVSGEGSLVAQVEKQSMEMSNVDIPTISQNAIMARMAYDGQTTVFKSLTKMYETAASLVK